MSTLCTPAERRPESGRLAELCRPGDATRLRIRGMASTCLAALEVAAVIGREFELEVLAHSLSEARERLETDLRQAVHQGVLQGLVPGRLRFAHATMRESLYRALGAGRAVRIHQRVGEALESIHGGDASRAAEIAHHFREVALAGGDASKAVYYSEVAAEAASAVLAYEEAVLQLERALEALGRMSCCAAESDDGSVRRLEEALTRARRAAEQARRPATS